MQNILADITAQNWILALFIRDDGERFLLGTGAYEFKKSLQHFQPNTYANDVIELQGTDGQLLAGQVRRTASQPFDGYIADQTINQTETENRRRAFLMFFRKKHFYTVAYILPNGTAIQRRRGYITDAPAVAEMIQRWPEYHVALNFEDPNYYEYAEDEDGNPIYAHEVELAIAGASVGGLVWDEDGVVWDGGIDWRTLQTVQGSLINLDNAIDIRAPLSSVELLGNTTQNGTPTPDAPVAVQTTTGEQFVNIAGKNLLDASTINQTTVNGVTATYSEDGTITLNGTCSSNNSTLTFYGVKLELDGTYTLSYEYLSGAIANATNDTKIQLMDANYGSAVSTKLGNASAHATTTRTVVYSHNNIRIDSGVVFSNNKIRIQFEKGSTNTSWEHFNSQTRLVNLVGGKNIFDKDNPRIVKLYATQADAPKTTSNNNARSLLIACEPNTTYTYSNAGSSNMLSDSRITFFKYAPSDGGMSALGPNFSIAKNSSATFTTPANAHWMMIYYAWNSDSTAPYAQMMIEKGQTASTYEAYSPIELCKLGDSQDYIYKSGDDWYIHKAVGKAILDGSISPDAVNTSSTNTARFLWNGFISPVASCPSADRLNSKCDHFVVGNNWGRDDVGIYFDEGQTGNTWFRVNKSIATTSAGITTWLTNNPVTLYYTLGTTAYDTQITNQALIDQLEALASSTLFVGVNNIALVPSGGAQGGLKIIYPTDYALTGGAIWAIGGSGGQNIITVDGVDSAFPVWEVVGPATNPILTNKTTGQSITWNGTVPNSQSLVVDMGEQTATMAGANVFQYIDGQWIRLDAGNNTLTYTATGATAPSILSWNGVVG